MKKKIRRPQKTNADSLGVAKPLPIVRQLFFTKLGPSGTSPSQKLYEVSASGKPNNWLTPLLSQKFTYGQRAANPAMDGRSCFRKKWRRGKLRLTQHWWTLLKLAYGQTVANSAFGGRCCCRKKLAYGQRPPQPDILTLTDVTLPSLCIRRQWTDASPI